MDMRSIGASYCGEAGEKRPLARPEATYQWCLKLLCLDTLPEGLPSNGVLSEYRYPRKWSDFHLETHSHFPSLWSYAHLMNQILYYTLL